MEWQHRTRIAGHLVSDYNEDTEERIEEELSLKRR